MSWAARFVDDGTRLRRIKLIQLEGERDALAHRRELLRRDLSVALVSKDAERSRLLSDEIQTISQSWLATIGAIRQLKEQAA